VGWWQVVIRPGQSPDEAAAIFAAEKKISLGPRRASLPSPPTSTTKCRVWVRIPTNRRTTADAQQRIAERLAQDQRDMAYKVAEAEVEPRLGRFALPLPTLQRPSFVALRNRSSAPYKIYEEVWKLCL
jgi:hypothetical protein